MAIDQLGELSRLAEPRRIGDGRAERRLGLLRQLGKQRRLEQAGRDGQHADAEAGELARHRQRQRRDAALGGRIGRLADLPLEGRDRCGRDDDPAAALGPGSATLIAAPASRIMLNVPMRLTRTTRSNASSGIGPSRPTTRAAVPMPAQLTRMLGAPSAARLVRQRFVGTRRIGDIALGEDPADLARHRLARLAVEVEHADARPLLRPALAPWPRRGPSRRPSPAPPCRSISISASGFSMQQRNALPAADAGRGDAIAQPERRSSRASVSASRTPVAPSGWPIAMAPPLTLSLVLVEPEFAEVLQTWRAAGLNVRSPFFSDAKSRHSAHRPNNCRSAMRIRRRHT